MPVYQPFYTDPALGQGFSNLAQAFAPPDPATLAAIEASRAQAGAVSFEQAARQRLASAMGQVYGDPSGVIDYDQLNNAASAYGALGSEMGDIMPFLTAQNTLRVEDPMLASNMGLANLNAQGVATGPDIATNVARQEDVAQRNSDMSVRDIFAGAQAGAAYPDPTDFDFNRDDAINAMTLALNVTVDDQGRPVSGANRLSNEEFAQGLSAMAQIMNANPGMTYDQAAQIISQDYVSEDFIGNEGYGYFNDLMPNDNAMYRFEVDETRAPEAAGSYNVNRNAARTARGQTTGNEHVSNPLPTPQGGGQPPPPINQRVVGETRTTVPGRGDFIWGRDENGTIGWVPDTRVSF